MDVFEQIIYGGGMPDKRGVQLVIGQSGKGEFDDVLGLEGVVGQVFCRILELLCTFFCKIFLGLIQEELFCLFHGKLVVCYDFFSFQIMGVLTGDKKENQCAYKDGENAFVHFFSGI